MKHLALAFMCGLALTGRQYSYDCYMCALVMTAGVEKWSCV